MHPATPMSEETVYAALYAALGLTDSILQIWITLTFAVIVSTYVAGPRFDRAVCRLVSGLYGLASFVLSVRFGSAAWQAFEYKDIVVERGLPWPVPNVVSMVIGGGTLALMVLGTIGTLWFVRTTWKRVEREHGG